MKTVSFEDVPVMSVFCFDPTKYIVLGNALKEHELPLRFVKVVDDDFDEVGLLLPVEDRPVVIMFDHDMPVQVDDELEIPAVGGFKTGEESQ